MKHFRFMRQPWAAGLRRALLGLSATALLSGLAMAPTANAAPPENVIGTCTATAVVDINPGLSLIKQDSSVTTHGQTGTVTCTLTVDGALVVGSGTFNFNAKLFGNCVAANGDGDFTIDLGTETIKRKFAFVSNGLAAVIHGDDFRSAPAAVPTRGELCVTPITQVQAVFPIVFIDG